jgi:putative transposase
LSRETSGQFRRRSIHEITDGFQAKRIIDNWIGFYNSERPHTALDKRTPDIAYLGNVETLKVA